MQSQGAFKQSWFRSLVSFYFGIGFALGVPTFFSGFYFALFGGLPFWAAPIVLITTIINCALRTVMWPHTVLQVLLGELTVPDFFFYHWT